jgi:hypothetical protein
VYPYLVQMVEKEPEIDTSLQPTENTKIIRNYKRGMIVSITAEMQKFDQVGKVRELGELMGRAARLGEEQDVMNVLTDPANYTHNNIGNYTFSVGNLMRFCRAHHNTLVVSPRLWWAVQQLFHAKVLPKSIDMVVVSPQFDAAYQWLLLPRGEGVVFQRVEPMQVVFEGANANTKGYFERDILRYRVQNWYGTGIVDNSSMFYSTSTTPPEIN